MASSVRRQREIMSSVTPTMDQTTSGIGTAHSDVEVYGGIVGAAHRGVEVYDGMVGTARRGVGVYGGMGGVEGSLIQVSKWVIPVSLGKLLWNRAGYLLYWPDQGNADRSDDPHHKAQGQAETHVVGEGITRRAHDDDVGLVAHGRSKTG